MGRIKSTFGDESNVQITNENLINWINDGVTELSQRLKFTQTKAITNLVANQDTYMMPSDCVEVNSVTVNGVAVPYSQYDTRCGHYYLIRNYDIILFPAPTENKTNGIVVWYVKIPARIVSPNEFIPIPDEYHLRLVEYGLAQAYLLDDDLEKYSVMMTKFNGGTTAQMDAYPSESYPMIKADPYE